MGTNIEKTISHGGAELNYGEFTMLSHFQQPPLPSPKGETKAKQPNTNAVWKE